MGRRPVVGVMGGSQVEEAIEQQAEALGRMIAEHGWVLLNGGRNLGVMAASARGAKAAGGMVVGVLPDKDASRASPDLDIAIRTGMGEMRNVINVLSSDVVVAMHGAAGTLSEVAFALVHERPVVTIGLDLGGSFDRYRRGGLLFSEETVEAVAKRVATLLAEEK